MIQKNLKKKEKWQLNRKKNNLDYKIMLEISKQCEKCSLREKCIEEDCILFRIEQLIVNKE